MLYRLSVVVWLPLSKNIQNIFIVMVCGVVMVVAVRCGG
jgi:hypothetical protein